MDKFKLLIVEDDINWFNILADTIKDELFTFIHVDTLEKTLNELDNNKEIQLILLDILLPDSQNGLETIRIVAEKAGYTPIIILSACKDEEVLIEALKHGVEDYLIKDQYDKKIFLHVVKNTITKHIAKLIKQTDDTLEEIINKFKKIFKTIDSIT